MPTTPFGSGPGQGSLLSRAIAARNSGQLAEADKLFAAAAKLDPRQVDAHFLLAELRSRQGRHRDALKPIQRALKLGRDRADIQALHGSIQLGLGDHRRACDSLRRAVKLEPKVASHRFLLGVALGGLDDFAGAARANRRAIELEPGNVGPWCNLGSMLLNLGEVTEAVACCEKAVELDPRHMLAWMNLGRALCEVGGQARAIGCYERALALSPGHPSVLTNLGQALRELGRADDAIAAFRRALEKSPDMASTRFMLAATRQHDRRDDEVTRIEEIARDPKAHGAAPHDALFALAKVRGDLGEEGAFELLLRANAARRRTFKYSIDDDVAWFGRIRQVFTADRVASLAGAGCADPTPIFVVGMPRSGTTLVEQILASHPEVTGAGELELIHDVLAQPPFDRPYPESFVDAPVAALRTAGERYVELLRARAGDAPFIVDKMPRNFAYLGAIRAMLPAARIVHCVRDPADTCASNFEQNFRSTIPYAFDLAELGQYHRLHDELMGHWRTTLGPGAFLALGYEDLVMDLEGSVRRLLDHVGLTWNGACLEFHRTERPVVTASLDQVRRPVHAGSIGRWRRWQDQLGPLLEALETEPEA